MDQKLLAVLNIPEEELGKGSPVALEVVQDDEMMCQAMAEEILALVRENNAAGRHTVFTVSYTHLLPSGKMAGQPISRMHFLQPTHLLAFTAMV